MIQKSIPRQNANNHQIIKNQRKVDRKVQVICPSLNLMYLKNFFNLRKRKSQKASIF